MLIIILFLVYICCEAKEGQLKKTVCDANVNSSLHPELQWRQTLGRVLHLEVYYHSSSCNFSSLKPNQQVENPSCSLKDAPLDEDPNLKVEFVNISTWESNAFRNTTVHSLYFNMQKALFRVPVELTQSVECELTIRRSHSEVNAEKKYLHIRNVIEQPIAFVTVIYDLQQCPLDDCTPESIRRSYKSLTKALQDNTTRLRMEPMENYTAGGRRRVTFRAWEQRPPAGGAAAAAAGAAALEAEARLVARLRERAAAGEWAVGVRGARFCAGDALWPPARAGAAAPPRRPAAPCAAPPLRRCLRDARAGARWGPAPPPPPCKKNVQHSYLLQEVAKRAQNKINRTSVEELCDVEGILSNITNAQISEIDIWSVAQVLGSIDDNSILDFSSIVTTIKIINKVLLLDEETTNLQTMQTKASTSTTLLQSLDHILTKTPLMFAKEVTVTDKIAALVTTTEEHEVTSIPRGIGVRNRQNTNFENLSIVEIPYNASLDWVLAQEFSAAVLLPDGLLHLLVRRPHRLALSVFWDSKLFGGKASQQASGHVLAVSVDGQHTDLQEPIMLFFDKQHSSSKSQTTSTNQNICTFWDFEADDGNGNWSTAGCVLAEYSSNTTDICICTHLTHFGKLLYNAGGPEMDAYQESNTLDTVTIVGCSVSLAGLAGVFVSAVMFPSEGTGRSIQLQLCGAQTVLMVALLWDNAASPREEPQVFCSIRGLLLHWSVLALGIWTLAAAVYQHQRLTRPLHALAPDPRFLPTATVLSWGTPVIVCGLVLLLSTDAYTLPTCYILGIPLILTVVIPLGCIVITNSIIFLRVIWSICHCNPYSEPVKNSQDDRTQSLRRILASAYLFFLLGLCWLFGFLNMQYLFCLTASMQGVSHFVFCVILDRTTRRRWKLYKKQKQIHFSSITSWTRSSLLHNSKPKQDPKVETLPLKK